MRALAPFVVRLLLCPVTENTTVTRTIVEIICFDPPESYRNNLPLVCQRGGDFLLFLSILWAVLHKVMSQTQLVRSTRFNGTARGVRSTATQLLQRVTVVEGEQDGL